MKENKGFTLIELLAVIVILGLLMAIAIPSVTKYITESRKKTLTTTVGNYISALVNEVNDLSYIFTDANTIYAVPIECISLERGGTDPFGYWYQANDAYFAYVLVQYDDVNSKYIYGFTFKDSAGYGLYPTIQGNIDENGKQVKTGYDLNRPKTGELTSLTGLAKWQESGFKVDSSTYLQVLEATSEGTIGDGISTCTLCQKGDNYAKVEEDKITCNSNKDPSCDSTPGILTGNGKQNDPYLIESMEDLVAFANIINNKKYETGFYTPIIFEGRKVWCNFYVELAKNLDFKDPSSYVNSNTKEFGDVNNNGIVEPLIVELNSGDGFPTINSNNDNELRLVFDGKNHYLKNYNYNIVNTDASKVVNLSLFGEFDGSFYSTNIANLALKDVNFFVDTAGDAYISPVIKEIKSYYTYQLSNISVTGKIQAKCGGACNVGGMAYSIFTYGNGADDAVNKINVNLDIDVSGNNVVVGGIASRSSNLGYYILDSNFTGDINVKATNEAYVGGINATSIYFKSVNSSVSSDIHVETKSGEVYGIGKGTIYNSFYKGDMYVKSYTPLNMAGLGRDNVYNSYAIGDIIVDAEYRYNFPKIGGLTSSGQVFDSYYIGNVSYNTNTSYGGGGPTVLLGLLSGGNSTFNSFSRGKITNTQQTTYRTFFGILSPHDTDRAAPEIVNSYYGEDSSYTGNAPCYYGGEKVTINNLKNSNWYINSLKLDNNWVLKDGYYPLINRCNFDSSTSTCVATTELLPKQDWVKVN
ncbi:MAG: type II secretion system protein [Firmicutes bacterium]|nr:type II secretion system protein [Bacillota bacterium]